MTDIFLVKGGVFVSGNLEGFYSLHPLFFHTIVSFSSALAQAPKLVCIGDGPCVFVLWMVSQPAEFQGLSRFFIEDRHGYEPWRSWGAPQVKQLARVLAFRRVHASDVEAQVSGG